MSPFELQVTYRLAGVRYQLGYKPRESDRATWRDLMLDEKADIYGRLCAASFLLEESKEAREFVEKQLKSKDLRIRYNAAKIVQMHVAHDANGRWGVTVLIQLLSDRSIDGSGVNRSPNGEFPRGDGDSCMLSGILGTNAL
jgi:hypothetical protein